MLTVHKCSDLWLFLYISNPTPFSLLFKKQITSEAHVLLPSVPNFMTILEMHKKVPKIFFDSEIIAFELVALNSRFY